MLVQLSQQTQAVKSGRQADPDYPTLEQGQSVVGADHSISGEGWGSGGGGGWTIAFMCCLPPLCSCWVLVMLANTLPSLPHSNPVT